MNKTCIIGMYEESGEDVSSPFRKFDIFQSENNDLTGSHQIVYL